MYRTQAVSRLEVLNVIDAIFRQGQSRTLTHPWRLFTLEQLSV